MAHTTSLSEAAQRYAEEYGIPVFPLYGTHGSECDCGDHNCHSPGKHPRTANGFKDATLDSDQIRSWWEQWPNSNIGMPTGRRSSYWVVDIDPPDGEQAFEVLLNGHPDLPEVPIQLTGRRGHQLFFAYNQLIRNSSSALAKNVDVRGEGGYVVLPPSRHVTGRTYEWERSLELGPIEAPEWLSQKAAAPPIHLVEPETAQGATNGKIPSGQRNDRLYRLARSFHAKGVDQPAALAALRAANKVGTELPLGDNEVTAIAVNAYRQPDRREFIEEREMAALSIVVEDAEQAEVSNAEYLSRPAIIERLYYTRHISLALGGKHHGKTTGVRTQALSIAMGLPIYGRETMQTPVLYAASPDEHPSTRNQLLRMGWNKNVPLRLIKHRQVSGAAGDAERVLADIARLAEKEGSRFVVLDMLFDFINVNDELKYAHTLEATGHVQTLADAIDGCVTATHHSPKWMLDVTEAAKAALGSQGIVARFSPALLYRRWAENLFTVESSATRDPRGQALEQTCVVVDENGWGQATEPFKSWMKWPIYAKRITDLMEGDERGKAWSVNSILLGLDTKNRPDIQNALLRMWEAGMVQRKSPDRGRRILYRLEPQGDDLFGYDDGWVWGAGHYSSQ